MRRAIGRLILWFTDPVTSERHRPWPCSDEARREVYRRIASRNDPLDWATPIDRRVEEARITEAAAEVPVGGPRASDGQCPT